MDRINPTRIMKALEALKEATRELEAALAEAERSRSGVPSQPAAGFMGRAGYVIDLSGPGEPDKGTSG
jgi:hypothetical protein